MPQYIIEYLAYTAKRQTNRILREFLENVYFNWELKQEYSNNHFYVTENFTYSVTVEVVFKKNSTTMCHFRFIGESVESIESIKRDLGNYWNDYFDEVFIVRDDVSKHRSIKSYDPIHQIESDLRHLILKTLKSTEDNWTENLPISRSAIKNAKKNMKKDINKYGSELIGANILQYFNLSHLIKIIDDNSGLFEELTPKNIEKLKQLKDLRNKMAHNRYLSNEDFRNISTVYSELIGVLRNTLNLFHNPP